MSRIPPLSWLRAFEAAARASSVSQGGRELNVSPSAVSQHIKRLEDALGAPLHMRDGNRLRLTADGERLAQRLSEAFDLVGAAINETLAPARGVVTIAAPVGLARQWLAPRVARRNRTGRHAGIAVLTAGPSRQADVIITLAPDAPCAQAHAFAHDPMTAVCAPAQAARLRKAPIFVEAPGDAVVWDELAAREPALRLASAPRIPAADRFIAIEAARLGLGFALSRMAGVRDLVAAGLLARPFPTLIRPASRYWAVCVDGPERAGVAETLAWLLADYAASADAD